MAIYHLTWRGDGAGNQTGWYIENRHCNAVGRIVWQEGKIFVVRNDGTIYRDCDTSHEMSFAAASELAAEEGKS